MKYTKILALDLEGTLVSNAISAFPRPGLYDFLSFCGETFDRVVVFTSVPQVTAKRIMGVLAAEGNTPEWFAELEVFVCERHTQKDLERIGRPGSVWLVDDQEAYILPGQRNQWIPIQEFMPPFVQEDDELARVREALLETLDDMEDVYLADQVIERTRSGEEETATLAEVEARLGLAHLPAVEALADLTGTLSPEAGETWLEDSRQTRLAGSWIGDQPVGTYYDGKLAGMIMRLFRLWEISSADKLSLLGLDSDASELLEAYEYGTPLPETEEMLKRVGFLLGIHKNLRILFQENRSLVYSWIKRYKGDHGTVPLDTMKTGLQGLASVYHFLDSEVNDYKIT